MDVERGAAWRRRQRRLRSWWRHEQQTVAAVLATVTHHSHSKVGTANAALRGQKTGTSTRVGPAEYFELSSDDGRPTGGERPAALLEPWPQGKMERHDGIAYELVQALDAPVLQTVEQLPNVVQFLATQLPVDAEPVIEVPKILPHDVPPRRFCRDTQLAEQLAEVPTILYFLKQRIPEQIVDTPVPHGGRGVSGGLQGFLPGHVEQTVDIPAPRSVRRLQGFLPEQSSAVTSSSSSKRISKRNVEQIAVSRGFGDGLQDFLPEQSSSSSSHDPARVAEASDELGEGVFRTFPQIKKSAKGTPHSSARVPRDVSSSTPAPHHRTRLNAWVMIITDQEPYYWDRRTGETRWTMEDGYSPSWLLRPDGRYVRLGNGEIYETLDGL